MWLRPKYCTHDHHFWLVHFVNSSFKYWTVWVRWGILKQLEAAQCQFTYKSTILNTYSFSDHAIFCKQNSVPGLWNKASTENQTMCRDLVISRQSWYSVGDGLLVRHVVPEANWYQQEIMLLEGAISNSAGNAMCVFFLSVIYVLRHNSGTDAILDATTLVFL